MPSRYKLRCPQAMQGATHNMVDRLVAGDECLIDGLNSCMGLICVRSQLPYYVKPWAARELYKVIYRRVMPCV